MGANVSQFFQKPRAGGSDYLARYPDLLRWMNRCVGCGREGHKPEMPESITNAHGETAAAVYLRRYFEPLAVDEIGLCEQCASAL